MKSSWWCGRATVHARWLAALMLLSGLSAGACRREHIGSGSSQPPPASLVIFTQDRSGEVLGGCRVEIWQLKKGTMSDEQGRGLITGIPPGAWNVIWRRTGTFGDSAVINFVAGQRETLRCVFRFESEEPNPYESVPER